MSPRDEQHLLARGIQDYVNALNAFSAFRTLVQEKCHRAVKKNVDHYAKALGIRSSEIKLIDYDWTDGTQWDIGVKYTHDGAANILLGHCLWWQRGDFGGLQTSLCTWAWTRRKNIELLKEVLRRKAVSFNGKDDAVVYLEEKVTADNAKSVDAKLDKLMKKWIDLWRKAGGIKALVP